MIQHIKQPDTILQRRAYFLIIILSCITVGGLLLYGPIPQDPSYHDFADSRALLAVPNFWNVVSNLPFVLVGIIGLHRCKVMQNCIDGAENKTNYILFFTGVLCTGLSSAYYHFQPTNLSLFWDRLSMALSFMAFLSIVIGEFIGRWSSKHLTLPLVLFGLSSVMYWIFTEQLGTGDLRPYVITQFLPILILPVIVYFWKSQSLKPTDIMIIGAGYGLAKLLESADVGIYQLATISGHSLKHLAAAFSAYWIIIILGRYQPSDTKSKAKDI